MNRKTILGITLILLATTLTLATKIPTIKANDRIVGVEVGHWTKYGDITVTWSSNDPNPPITGPPPYVFDINWLKNNVTTIVDTMITFQSTMHFENGTEWTQTLWIDIDYGSGMGGFYFISANLSVGDHIYNSAYYPTITETNYRMYAGVAREVNHANRSITEIYGNYIRSEYLDAYWDRATGVLCEYELLQTFTHQTEGYVTSVSVALKLIETNIWGPTKTLLGTGWGWMRIAHKEYVYGRAELYKIGDNQIELVIDEYSRTWNIIRHKEHENHEIYFCRSPEYGVLIVGLHHKRWTFWYAVGKDTIAFGHQKFGGLELMLTPI